MSNTADKTLNGQIYKMMAGESFEATISYSDYPANDGWSCAVAFKGNGFASSVACTTSGADFVLAVPASTTKGWKWGAASATAICTKGDKTKRAEMVCFTVTPDPTATTAEENVLAAIDTLIANYTGDGQRTISVDGMTFSYSTVSDLTALQARYRKIVQMQQKLAGGKGGTYAVQHISPENRMIGSPWYGGYPPRVR